MNNESLIRILIKCSIQRAIQESVAAVLVVIAFVVMLAYSETGSLKYYGCLIILVGTGFIAGVVWSYALSYRLLRTHASGDLGYWREMFQAQAKLLRLVPLWYCAPICAGCLVWAAPTSMEQLIPFGMVAPVIVAVCAYCTVVNRRGADRIDEMASQLT